MEDPSPSVPERIYIGGLQSHQLTARQVVTRIQQHFQDQYTIQWVDGENKEERPFVHLTAVPTPTDKPPSTSALESIAKHYNNVTWKGCKLKVQAAKPHFLERLAQERLEAKQANTTKTVVVEEITPVIPRRLSLRRRYGTPSVPVDTKPWTVDSHRGLEQRLQQRRKSKNTSTSTAYWNRAVHLRFSKEEAAVSLTSESEGSGDEAPQKHVQDHTETPAQKSGTYQWSDEDESNDSDQDPKPRLDEIEGSVVSSEDSDDDDVDQQVRKESSTLRDDDSSLANRGWDQGSASNSDAEIDVAAMKADEPTPAVESAKTKPASDRYQWSDEDDESDNDSEQAFERNRDRDFQLTSITRTNHDEFASGFDVGMDESDVRGPAAQDEVGQSPEAFQQEVLEEDIQHNLQILAQLFPDMPTAKQETADSKPSSQPVKAPDDRNSNKGWNAFGTMLRYDPTAKSSKQFEVDNEGPTESIQEKRAQPVDDKMEDSSTATSESEAETGAENKANEPAAEPDDADPDSQADAVNDTGPADEGPPIRLAYEADKEQDTDVIVESEEEDDGDFLSSSPSSSNPPEPESALQNNVEDKSISTESASKADDASAQHDDSTGSAEPAKDESLKDEVSSTGDSQDARQDDKGNASPAKSHIYEEGKLEQVFREVRESWRQSLVPEEDEPETANQEDRPSSASFSFGFDLGGDEKPTQAKKAAEPSKSGFSFSFAVEGEKPNQATGEPTDGKEDDKEHKKVDPGTGVEPMADANQATGSESIKQENAEMEEDEEDGPWNLVHDYTSDELNPLVEAFYSWDGGDRIQADPEGWRNDKDAAKEWAEMRRIFTLDWKRKRKQALARMKGTNKKQKRPR